LSTTFRACQALPQCPNGKFARRSFTPPLEPEAQAAAEATSIMTVADLLVAGHSDLLLYINDGQPASGTAVAFPRDISGDAFTASRIRLQQ